MVFNKYIDKSPTDEEFAALPNIIENVNDGLHEKVKITRYVDDNAHEQVYIPESPPAETLDIEPIRKNISPPLELYTPQDYQDAHPDNEANIADPLPIVLTIMSEYEPGVGEYGMPVYWSKITKK